MTILCIEDDSFMRGYIKIVFERLGFSTLLACDGKEGFEQFVKHINEIKYVILDMEMAVSDGYDFLALVGQYPPTTLPKILIHSSDSVSKIIDNIAEKNLNSKLISGFLQKPLSLNEFMFYTENGVHP